MYPREMCSVPLCQLCQLCQCASVPACQLCQRVKYNLSTDFPPVASFLAVRGHFPVQVSFSISAITIQGDQINF